MALNMSKVIQKARSELNNLTGLEISSTVAAEKEGDGWLVIMEVIEKRSIPDSMDILARYETRLDADGNMLDFKRTGMRKRIDVSKDDDDQNLESVALTPQRWLDEARMNVKTPELNGLAKANTWKMICDYLGILVEGDSAHRRLERWLQQNRPLWPSTYPGSRPLPKNSPMII